MAFKVNISEKSGKTYKVEIEGNSLVGKELYAKIKGKEISPELEGYELEITGASDIAGFPASEKVDGIGLKKVLLTYGKGMKKRPKREGKRKRSDYTPSGLRLRKTLRGKIISESTVQINTKVLKEGSKKLEEVFADQASKEPKLNRAAKRKQKVSQPKEKPAPEQQEAEQPTENA